MPAGRVGRPHGLDGSFHVTQPLGDVLAEGGIVLVGGMARRIERRAGTDASPILRLEGARAREDAEALRGKDLAVPRDALGPLEEGEFWAEDLEGCAVVDGPRAVGFVRRMIALPSCEALEVDLPDGGELLVPLVRDAIRAVDLEGRRIDVDMAFLGE